jgi:hypothetical protein
MINRKGGEQFWYKWGSITVFAWKDEGRRWKTSYSPKMYGCSNTETSIVCEFIMTEETITIIARSLAFSIYLIKYIISLASLENICHKPHHSEFTCLVQIMNIFTSAVSWSEASTSLVNLDRSVFSLPVLAKLPILKLSGRDDTSLMTFCFIQLDNT